MASIGVRSTRAPLPRGVVMVALPSTLADDLREPLRGQVEVFEVSSAQKCAQMLEHQLDLCVVLRVPSATEEGLGTCLLELRRKFPHVPCVACFIEAESDSRWTLRLGRAGVTELVTVSRLAHSETLLTVLSRVETDTVAVRVWNAAQLKVADDLVTLLKPALRLAHAPVSMTRLAGAARMHERTLRKYCDKACVPSPQWIVGWARLLIAAYYLEEPGRTIQGVAELLRYPSAAALANQVRRYAQITPSELRARGAVECIARLMEHRLGRSSNDDRNNEPLEEAPPRTLRLLRLLRR